MINKLVILIWTFSLAIGVFFLFKPFKYLDNDQSTVICNTGGEFNIGPNYIYSFEKKLDKLNDIKARKLCQFGTIRDYNNTYKSPETINYQFKPVYAENSSWSDAFLLSSTIIIITWLMVSFLTKKYPQDYFSYKYILISFLIGIIIYFLFLKNPIVNLYCQRQIAQKVVSFRNSAFKYGVLSVPEEDKHIKKITSEIFQKCLRPEF